ncbi:endo-1,4-beta-xylanase [Jeotgalibacillus sp. ET6]|uniref:endo-1,4-beta-xylanase n=1 Tax=Jeotgalibacillus sp. ET6 TaxID=3037260 RepID=UPI0024184317|nr:endo-1,4-beta-xylanase [Jeotgalibacillus sp. ET6]MDG5472393.1 endo-1,4-beta-xylanase [Jeotgalibacillus sp. ET6]
MTKHADQREIPALFNVFENDFLIGAAVNPMTLQAQKEFINTHFNSLTSENNMKFENLQPEEGRFTFEQADELMAFAKQNGKTVRGHTLVWHNQTPQWVFQNKNGGRADRQLVLDRMKDHIDTVVGRYKGQIQSWDVVNEAVTDSGDRRLRESNWQETIGDDFMEKAFEYAHLADPDAELFYNDYNESDPEKREKIYTTVKELVEKDVPIHGIGLQAHWSLHHPTLDHIRAAIERYASLGLKLHITEMDVSVFAFDDKRTDLTAMTAEMAQQQIERYHQFFECFREYSDVISSVTFWGVADNYTWLDDFPVQGRKNWPLLFDQDLQPKESFWKLVNR